MATSTYKTTRYFRGLYRYTLRVVSINRKPVAPQTIVLWARTYEAAVAGAAKKGYEVIGIDNEI